MTNLQLRIIARAVKIRVDGGEDLDQALDHYPKLSESEREEIKAFFEQEGGIQNGEV